MEIDIRTSYEHFVPMFKLSSYILRNSLDDFDNDKKLCFGLFSSNFKIIVEFDCINCNKKTKSYDPEKIKLINNNLNFLRYLAEFSYDDSENISGKVIDKFNEYESALFILDDKKYNNINEIKDRIFYINNSLYKLNKTIKLYSIRDLKELSNINNVKHMTLGEGEIHESNVNLVSAQKSITLKTLIYKLIRAEDILNSLETEFDALSTNIKLMENVSKSYKNTKKLIVNI